MKRKIIKLGTATLVISLPKRWTDRKGLKQGDQIDIKESDTTLIIGSDVQQNKETTIEINEHNKEDLKNLLTHFYRMGFNIIRIDNTDSEILKNIINVTNDLLLGFEVTDTEETRCRVENVSEPSQEKYETLFRRIFLIIRETQTIVTNDFKANKFTNMAAVKDLRNQQDKFILFCRRVISNESLGIKQPMLNWELLTLLMHIEHAYFYLYEYGTRSTLKKNDKILEMLDKLKDYYNLLYDAYFKNDIKCIHRINSLKSEYQYGACIEYLAQSKDADCVILSLIRELFRLIQLSSSPVLALVMAYSKSR